MPALCWAVACRAKRESGGKGKGEKEGGEGRRKGGERARRRCSVDLPLPLSLSFSSSAHRYTCVCVRVCILCVSACTDTGAPCRSLFSLIHAPSRGRDGHDRASCDSSSLCLWLSTRGCTSAAAERKQVHTRNEKRRPLWSLVCSGKCSDSSEDDGGLEDPRRVSIARTPPAAAAPFSAATSGTAL